MPPGCPLCGGDAVRPRFVKDSIPYYRCTGCHFVFSCPARNANLGNALADYEPAYLRYLAPSPDDERNHAALLRWAEGIRPFGPERVLDVGAGSGKFVRYLRRRNIDAFGLEPAAPLYAHFLADEPIFFPRTLEEHHAQTREETPWGVLCAWDVIEHLEDPSTFLATAAAMLSPGGLLFLSTPDVGSLLARLSGRRWHYYNRYHLSYFSRRTLRQAAARHGLQEVAFARLTRWKSLRYLLEYLLGFGLGKKRARLPARLPDFSFPINLFDTMYVAFELKIDSRYRFFVPHSSSISDVDLERVLV